MRDTGLALSRTLRLVTNRKRVKPTGCLPRKPLIPSTMDTVVNRGAARTGVAHALLRHVTRLRAVACAFGIVLIFEFLIAVSRICHVHGCSSLGAATPV